MPDMCPFEKKEKEVFLDYQFFFRNKKKFSKKQLLFSVSCTIMLKKNLERSEKQKMECIFACPSLSIFEWCVLSSNCPSAYLSG